jgi:hypothetical protein
MPDHLWSGISFVFVTRTPFPRCQSKGGRLFRPGAPARPDQLFMGWSKLIEVAIVFPAESVAILMLTRRPTERADA